VRVSERWLNAVKLDAARSNIEGEERFDLGEQRSSEFGKETNRPYPVVPFP